MTKRLAILPLFALLLAPLHNAHAAFMMAQHDTADQVWENYLSAESGEFELTLTVDYSDEYEDNAFFSLFIDGATGLDELGNPIGSYDATLITEVEDASNVTGGSMIQTSDRIYLQEEGGPWYFIYSDAVLENDPYITDVTDADNVAEIQKEITSFLNDLIEKGILINDSLPKEEINGVESLHYTYEIDTDAVVNELATYLEIPDEYQEDIEEAKNYITEHYTFGGEVWIDPVELYPTKFTFVVDVNEESFEADVELAIVFNSFNEPISIQEPENATDAIEGLIDELDEELDDIAFSPYTEVQFDDALTERLHGRILLQVEDHGEAWYVREKDSRRYYMRDGEAAYQMMRYFSLGITDEDLELIPAVEDTTEMNESTSVCASNELANRLKGEILLQVDQHGEAWYVDPVKCRRIYLEDGVAAYDIMRYLGLGITNADLDKIRMGINTFSIPPSY